MAELPRLNGIIRQFEQGKPAFGSFASPDIASAIDFGSTRYDHVIFEMEHNPYDIMGFRDALYYLNDRRRIVASGSVAPPVTPIARIPPNGGEMNQVYAKQVLDAGSYGVVWPHVSTAEQAYNAVAACRYPRPKSAPRYEPEGIRGDSPGRAARYWGVTTGEYYARADVWPLDPKGEILMVLMIEDVAGVANLEEIVSKVDGIGVVLIGEGDLGQNLGHPREYDHPELLSAMAEIRKICAAHDIPVGHPHVGPKNVERVLQEGYRFLLAKPTTTYPALEKGLELSGRAG
jgi:4-hydroxy-2-oxoheptanedioate aldolase